MHHNQPLLQKGSYRAVYRKRKRSTSPTGSQSAPAPELLPAPQHYFRVVGVAQAATLPGVQAQVVAVGAHPLGPLGGPWDDT